MTEIQLAKYWADLRLGVKCWCKFNEPPCNRHVSESEKELRRERFLKWACEVGDP